jgi:hypothetical protein
MNCETTFLDSAELMASNFPLTRFGIDDENFVSLSSTQRKLPMPLAKNQSSSLEAGTVTSRELSLKTTTTQWEVEEEWEEDMEVEEEWEAEVTDKEWEVDMVTNNPMEGTEISLLLKDGDIRLFLPLLPMDIKDGIQEE